MNGRSEPQPHEPQTFSLATMAIQHPCRYCTLSCLCPLCKVICEEPLPSITKRKDSIITYSICRSSSDWDRDAEWISTPSSYNTNMDVNEWVASSYASHWSVETCRKKLSLICFLIQRAIYATPIRSIVLVRSMGIWTEVSVISQWMCCLYVVRWWMFSSVSPLSTSNTGTESFCDVR